VTGNVINSSMLPDLRSSAHRRRLAALVEVAELERERRGQDQEEHDEYQRQRRGEVTAELAAKDCFDIVHYATFAVGAVVI
jgi:hypothetical protein